VAAERSEGGRVGAVANEIARSLRKRMTRQEVKLWVHLRSWRERGYHFRRQAPRDNVIVDFVCLKHRLIVEVDGGQHNFEGHALRDARRDRHFVRQGFTVLRFWNNDIDDNLEGVLMCIDEALQNNPPTRPPSPSPAAPASAVTLPRWGREGASADE
jgi:very-short-patch-repair endonuclease